MVYHCICPSPVLARRRASWGLVALSSPTPLQTHKHKMYMTYLPVADFGAPARKLGLSDTLEQLGGARKIKATDHTNVRKCSRATTCSS